MKKFFLPLGIFLCVLSVAIAQDNDDDDNDNLNGQSDAQTPPASAFQGGLGVNGTIYALAMQNDGKIILGGQFSTVNGVQRSNVARLNGDGTLDRTIFEGSIGGVNGPVYAVAVEPQGGIVIGGLFSQVGTVPRLNIARFNVDGTPDKYFDMGKGANGKVQAILIQPDGKIVIGGMFSQVGGLPRNNIARFNADTTLDGPLTRTQNPLTGTVRALANTGDDGSVASGGAFTIGGLPTRSIVKLPLPSANNP